MRSLWKMPKRLRLRGLQRMLVLLLFCVFIFAYCYFVGDKQENEDLQHLIWSPENTSVETNNEYLVWNPKCHMLSMKPYDPSILPFVKKEEFEVCSIKPKLSYVHRAANGSLYLLLEPVATEIYDELSCCWAAVYRAGVPTDGDGKFDSKISVGPCLPFKDPVPLNRQRAEVILVNCFNGKTKSIYKNVHSVINRKRARQQVQSSVTELKDKRALSVLMLGIDSVSRLNFHRTMPATRTYMDEHGWYELRAYNKMGENTFPNVMAILSGQNEIMTYKKCDDKPHNTLDKCPMIWYNFRDSGYVTAHAEDSTEMSTFNVVKDGFVKPPTDYYLRPYILAAEKLLKNQRRFDSKYYCTGPELSIDRIFDAAVDFSKAFVGTPSFGFFWANSLSHESLNGLSSYDERFLAKLRDMEEHGVMQDSVVVVLSDHGMRYGDIRSTFLGWYEERLPFVYIWLPKWFRKRNPKVHAAMLLNQDRLTSPYDLYETLRDILQRAGGQAPPSSGCPKCSSLFKPAAPVRGCKDAGISPHWCTCAGLEPYDMNEPIVMQAANEFVYYVNNITQNYKTNLGLKLCSKLSLKRILRVKKLIDYDDQSSSYNRVLKLSYLLELTPGDGQFETTIYYRAPREYTIREEEVNRINLYGHDARCLDKGYMKYCQCRFNIDNSILKWF